MFTHSSRWFLSKSRTRPVKRPLLKLKLLEDRTAPAVVAWDGGGGDFNWNNAANWIADLLPTNADHVEIPAAFAGNTVTFGSGSTSILGLTSHANLNVTGGELFVGADSHILGNLTVNGSKFGGSAAIVVDGLFSWQGTLQGAGSLTANGGSLLTGGSLSDGFDFMNSSSQLVNWQGGNIELGDGSHFENAGTMELWADTRMSGVGQAEFRNSGLLVKRGGSPTPELSYGAAGPTGSASLFILPTLVHTGTIDVRVGNVGIGYPNTVTTNSGTITGEAGTTIWLLGNVASPGSIAVDSVHFHFGNTTVTGSFQANRTVVHNNLATVAISGTILSLGDVIIGSAGGGTLDLTNATFVGAAATLPSLTIYSPHPTVTAQLITNEDLTVSWMFEWSGTLNGDGSLIANGGTKIHTVGGGLGGGFDFLNPAGQLVNWQSGEFGLGDGSLFENAGTVELWSDASLRGTSASEIRNSGTMIKRGGNPARDLFWGTLIGPNFTNSGIIELRVGTLTLGNPFGVNVNSGAITAALGTTLWLVEGFNSSGTIDADHVRFHVANAAITGSFRANRTDIRNSASTVAISGTILGLGDVVVGSAGGGTLDLTGATFVGTAATLPSLTIYSPHPATTARLITNEDLTVSGLFEWSGSLIGDGSLIANGGTKIHTAGGNLGGGFDFLNPAGQLVNWQSGEFGLGDGSLFENAGTMELWSDASLQGSSASNTCNTGTIVKRGGNPARDVFWGTIIGPNFSNSGSIELQVGTLTLPNPFGTNLNSGSITGAAGTTLWMGLNSTGTIDVDHIRFHQVSVDITGSFRANRTDVRSSGTTVAISGTILSLGDVIIGSASGGTLDLTGATLVGAAATLPSLTIYSHHPAFTAQLITDQDLTVSGPFEWSGTLNGDGSLIANGGTKIHTAGGNLGGGFDFLNPAGQLVNWQSGEFGLGDGSLFENAGTLELWSDGSLLGTSASEIHNTGTFIKRGGSTAPNLFYGSVIGPNFTNSGIIDLRVGTLALGNPFGANVNSGTITAESGTTLWLLEGLNSSGTIDADYVRFHVANAAITGSYRANRTALQDQSSTVRMSGTIQNLGDVIIGRNAVDGFSGGGTLDLTGAAFVGTAATLPSLTINSSHPAVTARLITDQDIAVSGDLSWNLGTLQGVAGQGSLTVLNNTILNGTYNVRNFNLINAGNIIWSAGTVNFYGDDSSFRNLPGASFTNTFDGSFGSVANECPIFSNEGLFVKSGGGGTTFLNMELHNSGIVQIDTGILNIHCGYVQVFSESGSGGSTTGPIVGDKSITNPGMVVIEPLPVPPPPVTNFTQTATGKFVEVIGGLTPGTQYGQIIVNGNVNLDGTLQVQLINGYMPAIGDTFTIIDNRGTNPVNGHFIGLDEPTDIIWAGNYGFTISYTDGDGNDVVLTMVKTAEILLSGRVFDDRNNDGLFNGLDAGISGVHAALVNAANDTVATAVTDADGNFSFQGYFGDGNYSILANQPPSYLDGKETAGTLGGTVTNNQDSDTITEIALLAADVGTGYNFAFIRPSRIQGLVWEDANDNGEVDLGEKAIEGTLINLTGTDDRGNSVIRTLNTDAQGIFEFSSLRPGNYTLTEAQPTGIPDGKDKLGTVNGDLTGDASVNDQFNGIALPDPGSDGINYNFGELRPSSGNIHAGQTAGIGFWQNRNGQNLIKSLNGGSTSTQLGNWLATTFPNMYGANAGGSNLGGKTNAQVANLYVSLFKRTANNTPGGPPKLDAQVMATALAVYVTNQNLAGLAAVSYGFEVTATGVATSSINIGSNGAAFGVANNTSMTVMEILLATDERAINGLLYDADGSGTINSGEQALRTQANDVFSLINELGSI